MPHSAVFFSQQLTFSTHTDFRVDTSATIEVYLFNSHMIKSEQISSLAEHYLHPLERAVFNKRKQQQAQQEYLASRTIIKTYANKCLGYNFSELYVLFDDKDNCLNVYHNDSVISLRCCISHSHGQVLVALVPKQSVQAIKLGVDLEWISTKRSLEKIAKHYYHPEELQACMTQTEVVSEGTAKALLPQTLYRIWTLKEALAKAIKQPIAKLIRDNVFSYCEQLNVCSGSYKSLKEGACEECDEEFDLSIISDLELTDNTNISILTDVFDQDFRKVK